MTTKKKIIISSILLVTTGLVIFLVITQKNKEEVAIPLPIISPIPEEIQMVVRINTTYRTLTLTEDPTEKTFAELVAPFPIQTILKLNRIDLASLKVGSIIVIPDTDKNIDELQLSPFPIQIDTLATIPKILLVSQKIQAFGAYEYGVLARWGPVSTGKQSTPTPSRLYFTNWKAKRAISTIEDSWILPWNFNLDNFEGISMHQYQLPGYPASHSCMRLLEVDAVWMYTWADQWILSQDEQTALAQGTPVLLFDRYAYGQPGPWAGLVEDSHATDISEEYITSKIAPHMERIQRELENRIQVTGSQTEN